MSTTSLALQQLVTWYLQTQPTPDPFDIPQYNLENRLSRSSHSCRKQVFLFVSLFFTKQCLVTHSKPCAPCLRFKHVHQRMGSLPFQLNLSLLQPGPEPSLDPVSSLVSFSCKVMSDSLWLHVQQQNSLPCLSLFHIVSSNSCPFSKWCHLTISSFYSLSFCPKSLPASRSLPKHWVLTSLA